jgi:hypothetical protein
MRLNAPVVGAMDWRRVMGHRVRWYVEEVVEEVTIRTLGGKFWLRPDAACKAIIEGVFGKALRLYPGIRLYGYDAQSNHLHYLFGALDPAETPLFLDYVHANIARSSTRCAAPRTFWSWRGDRGARPLPRSRACATCWARPGGRPGVRRPKAWRQLDARVARRPARAGVVRLADKQLQRRAVRPAPGRRASPRTSPST